MGIERVRGIVECGRGFQVRLPRTKGTSPVTKYFSFSAYGSAEKAHRAARMWRFAALRERGAKPTARKFRKTARNNTGVVGVVDMGRVTYVRAWPAFRVEWTPERHGKPTTKYVSYAERSRRAAFAEAVALRERMVARYT